MSNDETQAGRKVTVGFERKINLELRGGASYESEVASIYVEVDTFPNMTEAELDAAVTDAFFAAKSHVYSQLGLKFEVDEMGVIRALEEKLGAKVVSSTPKAQASTPKAGGAAKAAAPARRGKPSEAEIEDAWERVAKELASPLDKYGNTASFYVNIEPERKKSENSPDFKEKGKTGNEIALWLNNAPEWWNDAMAKIDAGEEPF